MPARAASRIWLWGLGSLLVVALAVVALPASSASETARQILDRRKALERGAQRWDDRYQRMRFTIRDRRGGDRQREVEVWDKKYPDGTSKALAVVLAPADTKGIGLLAHTYPGRRGDQWMYQPVYGRTRTLSAGAREEKFVDSDVTVYDLDLIQEMTSWSEDDARSTLRDPEVVDGVDTYVIELTPRRKDILYEKIVLWLGKDDLVPRRLEFYDDSKVVRRRITQSKIQLRGTIPWAAKMTVETPPNGSVTDIVVKDVRFNRGLSDDVFTTRRLERGAS